MKPVSGVGVGAAKPSRTVRESGPVKAVEKPAEKKVADAFNVRPVEVQRQPPTSRINFLVHPGMQELKDFARQKGWEGQGFTQLSIPWQEIVYTTDSWKTTLSLKSTEVPSPFVNGMINLPNVPKGTTVEYALHVGVACHAPADIAGYRERGDVWLNNGGRNFTQVTS